jgi:hypothetical protein
VRVGILLTCGKGLHDRIISLREDVWARKTSLNLQPFVEVRLFQIRVVRTKFNIYVFLLFGMKDI